MVPIPDLDDPQALRDRFHLLCAEGAAPGGFGGLPTLELQPSGGDPGQLAKTLLRVPVNTPIFADHFPRRAVFPGTLLMHANLQTAGLLVTGAPPGRSGKWVPRLVSDVKLRTLIAPGETLCLAARLIGQTDGFLDVAVESRINQRLVGSAQIEFALEAQL